MFILFPTGHEQTTARRKPYVTSGLVLVNILLFLLLLPSEERQMRVVDTTVDQAVQVLRAHPYLTPPPLLASILSRGARAALAEARMRVPLPPAEEQTKLDELGAELERAVEGLPSYRFGYRPAAHHWLGLLTHQFLHGGWLHLLGNMWFLWLAGYVIEDAWGRVAFPAFYLAAGVVGAFAHHVADPRSALPLIGASGAIAGVMGAFLVRNARTKIKFFAWIVLRPFRFQAPALVMLPLWFAEQLFWGFKQTGGVAYFAHVGGFVFGAGAALLLKYSGAEQRLDDAIENKGVIVEDPRLSRLAELTSAGNAAAAAVQLEAWLQREPRRIELWLELLRAAILLGDGELEQRARLKLMELYLQQGLGDGALSLYEELSEQRQRVSVPPSLRLRIARQYDRAGRTDKALNTLHALHARPDTETERAQHDWSVASAALVAHAELATKHGLREEALYLWERAAAEGDPQYAQIVRLGQARAAALAPAR